MQRNSARLTRGNQIKIAIIYAILATISTILNIASQELSLNIYTGRYFVYVSITVGTFVGLVSKYMLDKKFIFKYRSRNAADDARLFAIYSATGLLTTAIFWTFEIGFDLIFNSKGYRYLGACIGLSIGYWLKYKLDKKYVFSP